MLAVPVVLLLSACSGSADREAGGVPSPSPSAALETAAGPASEELRGIASASAEAEESAAFSSQRPSPGPGAVRDSFARLQATLNDSCGTPGNCEYLLNRVVDELGRLDAAMKADGKGPGHFPEPIEWIAAMRERIGEDRSYEHLKSHQDLIFGTRDRINVWMQDHPDDYR
ncbi:hypothetical protein [Streptomyces pini]|uniref:Uncharacterized protein n=1 Tax=Streptomyces pini TaxID=1520580 RepID=A0A1I3YPF2_9ACTN|nr:hypothetical protein [Streptomyces pini]SFK33665.1 hypothetical protein SAMN05192584_105146 [Streptomyces pini]